jgi:hypothetical protein
LSVRGVGRRTQPIRKLLNDLLITSALNPTCLLQSALNPTCLLQVNDFSTHGRSVQCKMTKNTHGYMTVWYTKGIYVSFVNCFVVILPHHKNLLLLAIPLVQYDRYSYKCLKSDLLITKCFKSDMLITSQWFFYSFVSGFGSLIFGKISA